MFSPFEELEYIADFLPEDGESVVISREGGELHCKPFQPNDLCDGIQDAKLYGFLVQANERLASVGTFPIWVMVTGMIWLCIALFASGLMGWSQWYVVPGLSVPILYGCVAWIRQRQHRLFRLEILPALHRELYQRNISRYALLAGVRQHAEFRTLLDELIHWSFSEPV